MRQLWIWACAIALAACGGSSSDGSNANPDGGAGGSSGSTGQNTIASGLRISEISLYQGVKVPLMVDGLAVPRTVPVVQGRDAMVRVFVAREPNWQPRDVIVRLEITRNGETLPPQEIKRSVGSADSQESSFGSTFNFDIAAADVTADMSYKVGLYEAQPNDLTPSSGAIFPLEGSEQLGASAAGVLEVVLVPIMYNGDGSGRLPDTGPSQVETLREHMYRTYPVSGVNIVVREPMVWNYEVEAWGDGWGELLQQLILARQQDNPPDNVYYYGGLCPADNFYQYCQQGCVAGLSSAAEDIGDEWARASLGVMYPGDYSAGTFIHEVGHAHGRLHGPCAPGGQIQHVDPLYPYADAEIGGWGYDLVEDQMVAPSHRDFMSYCDPTWVSDYTYKALFDRISILNAGTFAMKAQPTAYRMLQLNGEGELSVGPRLSLKLPPSGEQRDVQLLGAGGKELGKVVGRFHPFTHLPGGLLLVPEPEAGVQRLRVGKRSVAFVRR